MTDEENKMLEIFKKEVEKEQNEYEQVNEYTKFYYNNHKFILNLIEKQSKEIEELKKENLEIRDWKYVIDSPIDLDKLKKLDLIKIKGKEYVSKDKIKAKIEEVKDGTYDAKIVLESLLEKE